MGTGSPVCSPGCAITDLIAYTQRQFVRQNNEAFGYDRFDYLYLEDTLPETERLRLAHEKICAFFEEEKYEYQTDGRI